MREGPDDCWTTNENGVEKRVCFTSFFSIPNTPFPGRKMIYEQSIRQKTSTITESIASKPLYLPEHRSRWLPAIHHAIPLAFGKFRPPDLTNRYSAVF